MKEAASMLGIGLSNFKKLESEGRFPFKRKMVGSSVRYRNTDVYQFICAEDAGEAIWSTVFFRLRGFFSGL